ncbi:transcriptional repressor [Blastococcus sp. TML/M2B]|uniref:Fur family transcriptional regulator n=1 Tax=unclassified Blastococcus TaxID=2619396 RepID=UPI00190C9381|nr:MULTISPECIES: Fur family transcriptional regulator [unclassified Blastococcus]MBN1094110.1 transcriptional repressor [Blastococcus sp. TML/M2B]MBN1095769.1 transcriptional repressor [Blastococcus sp. TML/C7B]
MGSEGPTGDAAAPLAERLRSQGLRLTAQRQRVLAAVEALEHATPEAIGARLREEAGPDGSAPDSSTVYRNLELLERLGLVWHTHLGKGAPIYHASEHPHLHVVCASCGGIAQVAPDLLDSAAERLAAELGFTVDVGHVALSGTCAACRERARSENP